MIKQRHAARKWHGNNVKQKMTDLFLATRGRISLKKKGKLTFRSNSSESSDAGTPDGLDLAQQRTAQLVRPEETGSSSAGQARIGEALSDGGWGWRRRGRS